MQSRSLGPHRRWTGDEIAGWVNTLAALGKSSDGIYALGWANRWPTAGYTAEAALDAARQVVARTRQRHARLVWPSDVDELGIPGQPSLFE